MGLGEKLKALRINSRNTLQEQGQLLGVSLNTVYRWEHDQITPRRSMLKKIAACYNISIGDLLQRRVTDGNDTEYTNDVNLKKEQSTASDTVKELLRMFNKLPENSKHKALGYIEHLYMDVIGNIVYYV